MLKTTGEGPPPRGDRSFGELATQLVDDAKAYARAEADLVKAIAADKLSGFKIGAMLLVAAAFVAIGAINALCIAIYVALASLMSPILAGIVTFVLVGGVAGLLGWLGYSKVRQSL